MNETEVLELLHSSVSPPAGSEWRAADRGDGFWGATIWDMGTSPTPYVGAWTVVGPDSRLIRFSGNPQVHDPHHVIATLREWYAQSRTFTDDEVRAEAQRKTKGD